MAWGDADHRRESERRMGTAIARASASHMSNAKWLKFFAILRGLNIWTLRWKFVGQVGVVSHAAPNEWGLQAAGFGDVGPYPYGPFQ